MGAQGRQPVRLSGARPPAVVFVGEAPGRGGGPTLGGAAGRRLAELAGVPEAELRRTCAFVNLLGECPPLAGGGKGKGRTFDAHRAGLAAAVLTTLRPDAGFVLLGKRVAAAFGLRPPTPIWRAGGIPSVLVLPHPSGIVLFWNRAGNRRRAAVALRRFLKRCGVGRRAV